MESKINYYACATSYQLWVEYVCLDDIEERDFNAMTIEEKMAIQLAAFGKEPPVYFQDPTTGEVEHVDDWDSDAEGLIAVTQDATGAWVALQ